MTCMQRRAFLKHSAILGSSAIIGTALSGCESNQSNGSTSSSMRFAVLSDPHIYDSALGTEGSAFEAYLEEDRKMLLQSTEVLEEIVDSLIQDDAIDMLIIPGDLTKDGELICHQAAIELLQPLRDAGIQVFVVPGNHDINNPDAVAFTDDSTEAVDTINAEQFATLYDDFGYNAALYRDESSLSYIVEPVDGVWLIALDSCKYEDNLSLGSPDTSGALSSDLLNWLIPLLEEATQQGKLIFAMQHHGIVPHFSSQPEAFGEYLIDDYESVGQQLAEAGLNLIFTGHFHAQDIAAADYYTDGSLMLYDVETGSTVTAPCPYRIVDLDISSASFNISSFTIESIPSIPDFTTYKDEFINAGMVTLYTTNLEEMGIEGDTLSYFANLAASLHIAHYKGDENTDSDTLTTLAELANSEDTTTATLGAALYALAVDPGLQDNELSFSLQNGSTAMTGLLQRLLLNRATV